MRKGKESGREMERGEERERERGRAKRMEEEREGSREEKVVSYPYVILLFHSLTIRLTYWYLLPEV